MGLNSGVTPGFQRQIPFVLPTQKNPLASMVLETPRAQSKPSRVPTQSRWLLPTLHSELGSVSRPLTPIQTLPKLSSRNGPGQRGLPG